MRKLVLFLMIAGLTLALAGLCAAVDMAFEAEFADVIEAPMVVATSADAAALGPEPVDPSRGSFVWVPGAPATGGGGEGFMEFNINIPVAGTYAIWGRVAAWDGNSDSFWVVWQPSDPDENPQDTQNTEFRWGVAQSNEWSWDRINHWLNGGTFERDWTFSAGATTLRIYTREDAAMLDSIFVTDNLSDDEAEVGPRLPTDEDLTAVEPADKLAVTWGAIRSTR